jgi:hypothetical protein
MEAWLRDIVKTNPDGSVEFLTNDTVRSALLESLMGYEPEFTSVRAEALALFVAEPLEAYVDEGTPDEVGAAVREWLDRVVHPWHQHSMERFALEVVNARVVEMPATHHWLFVHKLDDVMREMRTFLLDESGESTPTR